MTSIVVYGLAFGMGVLAGVYLCTWWTTRQAQHEADEDAQRLEREEAYAAWATQAARINNRALNQAVAARVVFGNREEGEG